MGTHLRRLSMTFLFSQGLCLMTVEASAFAPGHSPTQQCSPCKTLCCTPSGRVWPYSCSPGAECLQCFIISSTALNAPHSSAPTQLLMLLRYHRYLTGAPQDLAARATCLWLITSHAVHICAFPPTSKNCAPRCRAAAQAPWLHGLRPNASVFLVLACDFLNFVLCPVSLTSIPGEYCSKKLNNLEVPGK